MISKEAVQPFSRYADLLVLVGFLPVLGHVKFGHILQHKQTLLEARKKEEAAAAKAAIAKKRGKAGTAEAETESELRLPADDSFAKGIPPFLPLMLLFLAELCASANLFDPSDYQVRRAVGVFGRARKKTDTGFMNLVESGLRLLEDSDVYNITRFSCMLCILSSLLVVVGLDMPKNAGASNPFKESFQTIKKVVSIAIKPRIWLLLFVLISFVAGNSDVLSKAIRRPATMELISCSSHVLRTMAAAAMATGTSCDGDLPFWCLTQAVAALARAVHIFGIERISWQALIQGTLTPSAAGAQGALLMEALTVVFLIPCILRKLRLVPLLLMLAVPCAAVLQEGEWTKMVEPFLVSPILVQNASAVLGVMGAVSLFMSGIPGVFSIMAFMQAMFALHRLEAVKI